MKRARRTTRARGDTATSEDEVFALQFRIWLKDVSPMVWRRVQVLSTISLREFHGVLQVVMGWEGIHLYQFIIHAARYGSWETGARSPAKTLGKLKLRKGSRFLYEYDLNILWEHEPRPLRPPDAGARRRRRFALGHARRNARHRRRIRLRQIGAWPHAARHR